MWSIEHEKVQPSVTPDQKAVFLEADSVLYPLTYSYWFAYLYCLSN